MKETAYDKTAYQGTFGRKQAYKILVIQMNLSYQNLSKMMNNETTSIKFENIERLCDLLECKPNDLFEITEDKDEEEK